MFSSLRNRLILSHVLPVLLIVPLTGVAMAYVLETRLLLPMVYNGLADDATLMAAITGNQPLFWQNRELAQALVDGVEPHLSGQISVLSLDGRVLAGTNAAGSSQAQVVELPDMNGVGRGETVQIRQGPLAEAFAPAFDSAGRATGVIRMTTRLVTVSDAIYQLRYLLGAVLLLGVLAGSGLGSYLAFQINRPIQRVTGSIQSLAAGNWQAHAPEESGPRADPRAGQGRECSGGPAEQPGESAPAAAGQSGTRAGAAAGRDALRHCGDAEGRGQRAAAGSGPAARARWRDDAPAATIGGPGAAAR